MNAEGGDHAEGGRGRREKSSPLQTIYKSQTREKGGGGGEERGAGARRARAFSRARRGQRVARCASL